MGQDTPAEQPSIEQQVTTLVDSMEKKDDKWVLPEGVEISPEMQYAAMAERRRRDTQSEYGRSQQKLKAVETENATLVKEWEQDVIGKLTDDQRKELAELKHDNPDAWRVKVTEYEQANKDSFNTRAADIKSKAKEETEIERRTRLFDEHNKAHPDLQITDAVIENDLPPRFAKQLAAGEITFEDFLAISTEFLSRGKVIDSGEQPPKQPNLSKAGGSSRPAQSAVEQSAKESYKDEIY